MVIAPSVAAGILLVVGLLVLVGSVIIFIRLDRATDRSTAPRTRMPLAWPISANAATSAPVSGEPPPADADASSRPTSRAV